MGLEVSYFIYKFNISEIPRNWGNWTTKTFDMPDLKNILTEIKSDMSYNFRFL